MQDHPSLPDGVVLAASATKLGAEARGAVVVSGSHGGVYPAFLAARAGARAVVLNDAGVGREGAGIACLDYCRRLGMAAATVDCASARIGDAVDSARRGRISQLNDIARGLGLAPGQPCLEAAALLVGAAVPTATPEPYAEARQVVVEGASGIRVICMDSASMVEPADAGQIVVTGSHGGLVGGQPEMALKADALAALFNDAGVGIDEAGITRLPALDGRGIAAATVAAASARIGDGRSTYFDGILSRVNETAAALGGAAGMAAREFVERLTADGRPSL